MSVKVSICIPTYNQTEFLKKNLESIAIQTFKDFEVIITDDSTTNDVQELVETFFLNSSFNYIYHKNKPRLGSPANWNRAISLANGEYIKIMHHDDWFTYSDSLEKFMQKATEYNSALIFSEAISINEKENIKKKHSPSAVFLNQLKINPEYLFLGNLIGPPSSVLFKRSDFINFNTKLKWLVDVDFYISILNKTKQFGFIAEPIVTSVNNASHNVTNSCINPETEVYEFFYLYSKLTEESRNDKRMKKILIDLLVRYNIQTLKQFKQYSAELEINKNVSKIIQKAWLLIKFNKIKSYVNFN